ncbi:metal-binding-domain/4Fe-4S-binding-domain containing ABC transporter, ATP-binding protein [Archaeoglobus sulfaticallidus PM70-1]|uniref:Metal-binding-domain/4Fe-4S-binding-domain containing ABC transporter, ATP-binding protein n=2 Tax=Archaeoglobus TaxID=2233 RepID=N0BM19_9EURY|nr:metal-binding-domain/4Fe-4S-binding-domain containing ABC transporter, ATP-binding protein [Archaeoglobus sulfaticallidus PM70-1]
MRLASLVSGGKDSLLATHLASEENEIDCLVSVVSSNPDSYMFHTPNIHLVDATAIAMDLPLFKIFTRGEEELEVKDLIKGLRNLDVDGIVIGGIASSYQKKRFELVCEELGLKLIAPLWGKSDEEVMKLAMEKMDFIIVKVSAMGLSEKWVGRKMDEKALSELKKIKEKYGINLAGEGGEFETLVLNAPMFKKRIEILESHVVSDNMSAVMVVDRYRLVDKG